MFHLFKRLSVVKDLVLHKLDTIIINQESQNVLQPNLERLMQEQQENLQSMLLVQKTEIKELLDRQFQESIHQQPNTNSPLVLQMAEELFDANKFSELKNFMNTLYRVIPLIKT